MASADTARRLPYDDGTGIPVTVSIRVFAPNEQFGRYQIVEKLGGGGMGSVYRAFDTSLARNVALKIPHICLKSSPELVERFRREAQAMATLSHPNICQVFDVGNVNGTHYLTMALVKGETLSQAMEGRTFSIQRVVEIVRTIAIAMHEAHMAGVVHRDIKPGNIMLDQRGNPVVIDFGLACDPIGAEVSDTDPILGTPAYMSPEQARREYDDIGPRSDIFSLGVVLYRLLSNRLPFEETGIRLLSQIQHHSPTPLREISPEIPTELERICFKCLAKNQEDRFQSMSDLASALEKLPILRKQFDSLLIQQQSRATITQGFKYDVFISYAPLDDQPAQGESRGWVLRLIDDLAWRLCQLHGRTDEISFAISHDPIHELHVSQRPRFVNSSVILLVDSPGFRNVVWNRPEAKKLRDECRHRIDDVIVVEPDRPLNHADFSPLLSRLPHRFWTESSELGVTRLEGDTAHPARQYYYAKLDDLARQIYSRLVQHTQQHTQQVSIAEPGSKSQIFHDLVVYLADVPNDLQATRERVRRFLDQLGCEILPFAWQSPQSQDYAASLKEQLSRSDLFIQLLGSQLDAASLDGKLSATQQQFEIATEAGCPILQWRDRVFPVEKVANAAYRELLLGSHVQGSALPEFHRSIQERLLTIAHGKKRAKSPPIAGNIPLVFINVNSADLDMAQPLCAYLADHGLALALPLPEGRPEDTLRDLEANLIDCDGLLIAYNSSPIQWAREQLRIYRRIMQRRTRPLRALAVLEGPSGTKQPLGMMLPNLDIINCHAGFETAYLRRFLEKLNLSRENSALS